MPGHLPTGQTRTDLCELIDTTRTLMSLAGLGEHIPADVRGRDLFGPAPAPEAVFGQIGWPEGKPDRILPPPGHRAVHPIAGTLPAVHPHAPPGRPHRPLPHGCRVDGLRGRRVPREEMDGNLFDLQADPHERVNLFSDPNYAGVVDELLGHLERWDASLDHPRGCFPPGC